MPILDIAAGIRQRRAALAVFRVVQFAWGK
jgi:hypothetical protein